MSSASCEIMRDLHDYTVGWTGFQVGPESLNTWQIVESSEHELEESRKTIVAATWRAAGMSLSASALRSETPPCWIATGPNKTKAWSPYFGGCTGVLIDPLCSATMLNADSGYSAQNVRGEHGASACQRQSDNPPSLSAAARAMTIPELQLNIVQLVDINSARKKTLLALALTCTSFTGMALDFLWRNLDNFNPLIKCLPSSLWKITRKENELVSKVFFHA